MKLLRISLNSQLLDPYETPMTIPKLNLKPSRLLIQITPVECLDTRTARNPHREARRDRRGVQRQDARVQDPDRRTRGTCMGRGIQIYMVSDSCVLTL